MKALVVTLAVVAFSAISLAKAGSGSTHVYQNRLDAAIQAASK